MTLLQLSFRFPGEIGNFTPYTCYREKDNQHAGEDGDVTLAQSRRAALPGIPRGLSPLYGPRAGRGRLR